MNRRNATEKTILYFIFCIAIAYCTISCKTYLIPVTVFKQQFAVIDSPQLREVTTSGPMGDIVKYKAYAIDYIKCYDKKGHVIQLKNSPSLEIRFTDTNNKKTIFYFDLISVRDSFVFGIQSRFFTSIRKKVNLNKVKKIEIQDGRKQYHYVNNKYR